MSTDEEMAIIGKLVVEQRDLAGRNAALHAEIHRIGSGLEQIGKRLTSGHTMFHVPQLSSEEMVLLDDQKIRELLSEKETVVKRYDEVHELLRQAGIPR